MAFNTKTHATFFGSKKYCRNTDGNLKSLCLEHSASRNQVCSGIREKLRAIFKKSWFSIILKKRAVEEWKQIKEDRLIKVEEEISSGERLRSEETDVNTKGNRDFEGQNRSIMKRIL